MEGFFGILVFFVVGSVILEYILPKVIPYVVSAVFVIAVLYITYQFFSLISRAANNRRARYEKEERERLQQEQREDSRRQLVVREKDSLKSMVTDSTRKLNEIPAWRLAAERALDKAEEEFAEGVFAPFWDCIENATNNLVAYNREVSQLVRIADDYNRRVSNLPEPVPAFSLPLGRLPDARPTAERLARIVRRAQKDFHFSTIYEQRKTNRLLYEGFNSLGDAIYNLGDSLSYSLSGLSDRLDVSLEKLIDSTQRQTQTISDNHEDMKRRDADSKILLKENAKSTRNYEKESLNKQGEIDEKLDNIQRGKKPHWK